jgi:electron transfer flavoprotein alpha subunit
LASAPRAEPFPGDAPGTPGARGASDAGEVWVWIEIQGGQAADVSLELLGRARELADGLGVAVGAVLVGRGSASLAPALIAAGADRVYVADHEALADYLAQPYARVVGGLVRRLAPQIVLYGATSTGRDLAPRVASLLRTGLTADCTDLRLGDHTVRGVRHERLLLQIRPAFGGNIIATIVSPEHRPQMASVREGVMRLPEPDASRRGKVVEVQVARRAGDPGAATRAEAGADAARPAGPILLADDDLVVRRVRRVQEEKRVDLKGARIVVAGGAGVGSRDGWALVHELAETLGGVVGASRAAMDGGWVGPEHQVGQTGTTVRPKLYIAAGISGAIQHRAGMDESARILAINTDPDAPIFSIAHYGIVGDLHEVIPRLLRAYRSKGDVGSDVAQRTGKVQA